MRRILIVTDNASHLDALSEELAERYDLVLASTVADAVLQLSRNGPFVAIIAEHALAVRDDEISGAEGHGVSLLVIASRLAPGSVRILVGTPLPSVTRAATEVGVAHAAFGSDWAPGDVAAAIARPNRDITPVTKA